MIAMAPHLMGELHSAISHGVSSAAGSLVSVQTLTQWLVTVLGSLIAIGSSGFTLINGVRSFNRSNEGQIGSTMTGIRTAYEVEKTRREQSEDMRTDLERECSELKVDIAAIKVLLRQANADLATLRLQLQDLLTNTPHTEDSHG